MNKSPHQVVSSLILLLHPFAKFGYYVINPLMSITNLLVIIIIIIYLLEFFTSA